MQTKEQYDKHEQQRLKEERITIEKTYNELDRELNLAHLNNHYGVSLSLLDDLQHFDTGLPIDERNMGLTVCRDTLNEFHASQLYKDILLKHGQRMASTKSPFILEVNEKVNAVEVYSCKVSTMRILDRLKIK